MNKLAEFVRARAIGFWFAAGAILGLAGSGAVAGQWLESGSGTTIQVLGSGSRLSVLITHDQRRVLIASGTDGAAHANALSSALPPIFDSIDVVLIDPTSSPDVVERTRNLDAKHVFILPAEGHAVTAQTLERSFAIDLGSSDPMVVEVSDTGWTVVLATPAGTVMVGRGETPFRQSLIAIDIDGAGEDEDYAGAAVVIFPADDSHEILPNGATVGPGAVMTISGDGPDLRLDQEFFAEP